MKFKINQSQLEVKPKLINITREGGIPLIGCIAFGIIDRGTNLLQVRCTSACNMKCPFCSTAANSFNIHPINYIVDIGYLLDWVKEIVKVKGNDVKIFLDSVGDPLTHPKFVELVRGLREINEVSEIAVITNGTLLNKEKIDALEKAGLTQVNISLHTLNEELGKKLFGSNSYDLDKVIENIRYIAKSRIKLVLTPVWLPNVNDEDIEEIVKFSKEIGCMVGIQNYEIYKYSRKMKEAKKMTYWKFYRKIEELEKKYNTKLKVSKDDFGIEKRSRLEDVFKIGEKVMVEVKCNGWIFGQKLGVVRNRCVSINNCNKDSGLVKVKIIENKNSLYIAETI